MWAFLEIMDPNSLCQRRSICHAPTSGRGTDNGLLTTINTLNLAACTQGTHNFGGLNRFGRRD